MDDTGIISFFSGRYASKAITSMHTLMLALRKMKGDANLLGLTLPTDIADLAAAAALAGARANLTKLYEAGRCSLIEAAQEAQVPLARLYSLPPPKAAVSAGIGRL